MSGNRDLGNLDRIRTRTRTQQRCGMPAFETAAKSCTPTAKCILTFLSFIFTAFSASLVLVHCLSCCLTPALRAAYNTVTAHVFSREAHQLQHSHFCNPGLALAILR